MEITPIIGTLAACLTTISFLPQALKTIRSGHTKHLSLPMYVLFVSGVILWILYGIKNHQFPIIVGNSVTLILSGVILYFKLREVITGSE